MSEWCVFSLGELFRVKHGFAFKSEYFTDEPQNAVLVTPGNFAIGGGFQDSKRKYYNGQFPEDYVLKPGQVVVTMTDLSKESDTLGYAASIPNDSNIWLHNQRVGLLEFKNEIPTSPRFVEYLLRTHRYRSWIVGSATGTTVKHTAPGRIESFTTHIPPIGEQRAIAHILGTLDDKIELNRKQNETLEAMARALFKAWFVDFEPVRAKMEGRWVRGQSLPGLPAHLYDLFPDKLVESELGEIPEGWQVMRVGDIGDVICGKTPSTQVADYYGEDIPFITIPEMHGNIFACGIKKRLSLKGAESQIKKMLPSGAICVSCIATLGLVNITTEPSQTNQQINSVVPAEEKEIYFWYWALKNMGEAIKAGGSGGSVLDNLSTGRFVELQVKASIRALRLAYNSSVEHLFSQILANAIESQTLCQLRDTLLPKLISGELRVSDIEKHAEGSRA